MSVANAREGQLPAESVPTIGYQEQSHEPLNTQRQSNTMKHPLRIVPTILTVGLLSVGTALAGSFTTDFSSTLGVTLGGNGTYYAFIETNRAILTPAVNSLGGSITIVNQKSSMDLTTWINCSRFTGLVM